MKDQEKRDYKQQPGDYLIETERFNKPIINVQKEQYEKGFKRKEAIKAVRAGIAQWNSGNIDDSS